MFQTTFLAVLISLLYMIPGYIFCKIKKVRPEHLSTMSYILIYFCSPCMIVSAFLELPRTKENVILMGMFFVFSLLVQLLFFVLLYLIIRKKQDNPMVRLMSVGSVLGNVGFFGLPLIKALFPQNPEVACYSCIYVVSMNLLVFTIGVYGVTGDRKAISFKNVFVNPAFVSFLIAVPLYLSDGGDWFPQFLGKGIDVVGKMTTPLCMLILGIRLATIEMKKLFTNKYVYLTCGLKLLVLPLFTYGISFLFSMPDTFRYSALILAGTPCASVLLGMAEMKGKSMDLAANCILLSTLMSIVTLPLLSFLIKF
jgi:predicted permease